MISSEKRYAQAAYSSMTDGFDPKDAAVFGTICHQFPSMVRLNGLRLTAIFYDAKASASDSSVRSKAYSRYCKYMEQALELQGVRLSEFVNSPACDSIRYRLLSRQALAASIWFKRYAEAILKVDAEAQEVDA
ncbi:type III-B CRISPR module-associated protein Cmr5 [Cohnella faecalis]|uniref:CRISPR type III-B/RAMP module-associated protein Cmr5 n=1 Tax=Cohnella faecalis TaxID=2315694 RepID=A0A398CPN5_9BACL|nr:type III-B CRISPR module-associated protein Cmr5 [Cohnella faecalis]RIE05376.1 type III-B CRISPR module-associated protein Cmr5 [Cohnella faecalis]